MLPSSLAWSLWLVGLASTLYGTAIAWQARVQAHRRFGTGPMFPRLVVLRDRLLRRKPPSVHVTVNLSGTGTLSAGGQATVYSKPAANAALYQQVQFLRGRVDDLQKQAHQAQARQDQALGKLSVAVTENMDTARSEIVKLHTELSDVAAGSAPRELVGLGWIVFGALCSAMAGLPV